MILLRTTFYDLSFNIPPIGLVKLTYSIRVLKLLSSWIFLKLCLIIHLIKNFKSTIYFIIICSITKKVQTQIVILYI
jgi:hypothetical protein